jgi:hypothetical protein
LELCRRVERRSGGRAGIVSFCSVLSVQGDGRESYKVKRVRSFVEVIHYQVYPYRVESCSNRELVVVPFVAGEVEEGR